MIPVLFFKAVSFIMVDCNVHYIWLGHSNFPLPLSVTFTRVPCLKLYYCAISIKDSNHTILLMLIGRAQQIV